MARKSRTRPGDRQLDAQPNRMRYRQDTAASFQRDGAVDSHAALSDGSLSGGTSQPAFPQTKPDNPGRLRLYANGTPADLSTIRSPSGRAAASGAFPRYKWVRTWAETYIVGGRGEGLYLTPHDMPKLSLLRIIKEQAALETACADFIANGIIDVDVTLPLSRSTAADAPGHCLGHESSADHVAGSFEASEGAQSADGTPDNHYVSSKKRKARLAGTASRQDANHKRTYRGNADSTAVRPTLRREGIQPATHGSEVVSSRSNIKTEKKTEEKTEKKTEEKMEKKHDTHLSPVAREQTALAKHAKIASTLPATQVVHVESDPSANDTTIQTSPASSSHGINASLTTATDDARLARRLVNKLLAENKERSHIDECLLTIAKRVCEQPESSLGLDGFGQSLVHMRSVAALCSDDMLSDELLDWAMSTVPQAAGRDYFPITKGRSFNKPKRVFNEFHDCEVMSTIVSTCGGVHWVAAVWTKRLLRFTAYDSMATVPTTEGLFTARCEKIRSLVAPEIKGELTYGAAASLQQGDGTNDCGLYALYCAAHFKAGRPFFKGTALPALKPKQRQELGRRWRTALARLVRHQVVPFNKAPKPLIEAFTAALDEVLANRPSAYDDVKLDVSNVDDNEAPKPYMKGVEKAEPAQLYKTNVGLKHLPQPKRRALSQNNMPQPRNEAIRLNFPTPSTGQMEWAPPQTPRRALPSVHGAGSNLVTAIPSSVGFTPSRVTPANTLGGRLLTSTDNLTAPGSAQCPIEIDCDGGHDKDIQAGTPCPKARNAAKALQSRVQCSGWI